jgi:hypothetical protein
LERQRRLIQEYPEDPLLQLTLARLLLSDGWIEEALATSRHLLSMNAESAIWEEAGNVLSGRL